MKFNSQICTTREQSERLIALGLKTETADMIYHSYGFIIDEFGNKERKFRQPTLRQPQEYESKYAIPAWSLHRLIEVMPQSIYHKSLACFLFIDQSVYVQYRHSLYGASQTIMEQFMKNNLWENLIGCIEWLIKEGYFPKKYLVGLTGADSHQDMVDAFGYAFEVMKAKKEE